MSRIVHLYPKAQAMALIKALIFDLDNTLFDRDQVAREVLNQMGLSAYLSELMDADAGGKSDRLGFAKHAIDLAGLEKGADEFWIEFRDKVADSTPYDLALREMVIRLRKEFRIGVLSNGGSSNQRKKIRNLGIEDVLDVLVISGEHPFEKPDAKAFYFTCDLLGTRAEDTLMIGNDYESDYLGARAAGLQALLVGDTKGETSIRRVAQLELWLRDYKAS